MNDTEKNTIINKKNMNIGKNILKIFRAGGVYFALLFLIIISGILSPTTISPSHLLEVLRNTAILGIICISQTLLILTRGIDLSVGASVTLINLVIAGVSLGQPENTAIAIVIALLLGMAIGLFNGFLAVKLKIEPLVGSLGVMILLEGLAFLYTRGFAKGITPPFIKFIGVGKFFNLIPVSTVLWAVVSIIIIFILKRTLFGRSIFAVGSNPSAAAISGIKVDRVRLTVYLISGLLIGIAGIVWSGFLGTPTLTSGEYFPLDSIAAVIIGGTTFAGGKGGIGGSVVGAIIIVYLSSFLTIIGIGVEWKIIAQGLIILLLVFGYTGRKNYK